MVVFISTAVILIILYWFFKPVWDAKADRRRRAHHDQYKLDEFEEQTYYHKY
jgi:hypothetical protein